MTKGFKLIHVIVNKGKASKVLKEAKKNGARGGTIYRARGTVQDKLLNFLSIYDQVKEMVIMCVEDDVADVVIPKIVDKFDIRKPNTGIVFTTNIEVLVGAIEKEEYSEQEEAHPMYKLLTAIVDKGKADEVVEAANSAGARGGTVLHARGSGTKETMTLFNIEIEPEKDVVMILLEKENLDPVIQKIDQELEIRKPGKGILFVQDIDRAVGIFGQE